MPVDIRAPENASYLFEDSAKTGVPYDQIIEKYLPLDSRVYHARPVPGTTVEGHSPVYRNLAVAHLKDSLLESLTTYSALWCEAAKAFRDRPALAMRPYDFKTKTSEPRYVSETFGQVDTKARNLGAGLLHLLQHNPFKNPALESHQKIDSHLSLYKSFDANNTSFILTLFSGNRPEWVIADLACTLHSITNTVLYDTLGPNASEYILSLVSSPVLITSYEHVAAAIDLKQKNPKDLESLICVVSMDPLDSISVAEGQALVEKARQNNIELFDLETVYGVGALFPQPLLLPNPETPYTISFTSGTTGSAPKGVVLTQRTTSAGMVFILCMNERIKDDVEMAFLPLAHIFERQCLTLNLCAGGMSGFPQMNGTPLTLVEDLKLLKPKHMANVPRVYTKFEAAIKGATIGLNLAIKKALFSKIIGTKMGRLSEDGALGSHWLYDRLFIQKVREGLGFDRMVYCVTGLAPISPLTMRFMKAALNIGFNQGYGLTELFAGMSFSEPFEEACISSGAPGVCCDVRVKELPTLGYMLDDKRGYMGELQLRGPQVFDHYFKNKEETEKVLQDGWFSTGDVACIERNTGRISIVDRVKNFFKLSQGEYVTPEKIENIYLSANSVLTQCFAHGESIHNFLVGVVGVDKAHILTFLTQQCGVDSSELSLDERILELVNSTEARAKLLRMVNQNVTNLAGFEKLKNVYVEFEPLTLEREVITPTVKLRRPIAAKFFRKQIDAMYSEGGLVQGDEKLSKL